MQNKTGEAWEEARLENLSVHSNNSTGLSLGILQEAKDLHRILKYDIIL